MKPYMPATPENYQRVLRDIHARAIQMWAGCIWVPIYEVMTRKHLTIVTLEENLELAADIGLEATTSIEGALTAALERHGRREGRRPPVRALPAAAERGADGPPTGTCSRTPARRRWRIRRAARFQGLALRARGLGRRRSRDPRLDDDPRAPADVPRRPRGEADGRDPVPVRPLRRGRARAAHACGDAPRAHPRAVLDAFRALERRAEREQLERAREREHVPLAFAPCDARRGRRGREADMGRPLARAGRGRGAPPRRRSVHRRPRARSACLACGDRPLAARPRARHGRPFGRATVDGVRGVLTGDDVARLSKRFRRDRLAGPALRRRGRDGAVRRRAARRGRRPRPVPRRGRGRARRGRLRPARSRARSARGGGDPRPLVPLRDVDEALEGPTSSCARRSASRGSRACPSSASASSATGTRRPG